MRKSNVTKKEDHKINRGKRSPQDKSTDYNVQKSRPNDWRWYAQNEQLLKDAASYPYSWPLGTRLNLGEHASEVNKTSVPGVMAIWTMPAFGYADNANAPVNVAARNIYSYVRHANSGHANYDAPDLMLYLCAMDSIYSYIAYLKRIYGVAQTYSYTNRYYPRAMITAMNVNFDDIQRHLADFRAFINTLVVKAGSMCIPASMSYMAKHMWMYTGMYLDSPQDKSQTYFFNPFMFFRYDLDEDGAGCLKPYYLPVTEGQGLIHEDAAIGTITFEDLVSYGTNLLDPVLMSEDMNIMSGDILKAFGAQNVYKLDSIAEGYTVLPVFDDSVLDQIQNLSLIDMPVNDSTLGLFQSSGKDYLVFTPKFQHSYNFERYDDQDPGANVYLSDRFVTFEHGNITPAETMEATRMCNIAREFTSGDAPTMEYHTIGSEVACIAKIFRFQDVNGHWMLGEVGPVRLGITHMLTFHSLVGITSSDFMNVRDQLSQDADLIQTLCQFNRHPAVSITTGVQDANTSDTHLQPAYGRYNGLLLDINYYAVIGENDLIQMAETALMSMFNITQYGRAMP